ncbi:MAG: hypothetical protein IAE89_04970 [Anaerolineae bacterium]|nr:hypothetical protein [Anaerolineae bacterium]
MRRLTPYLIAFGVYLAMAILVTYPLIAELNTRLIGHPFGDTYEYVRHIWAIHNGLRAGDFSIFWHQPLLLYSDGLSSAWLFSIPLQSFPQWLLLYIMPLPAAHNLTALVTLALNGLAMFTLSRRLTRDELQAVSDEPKGHLSPIACYFPPILAGLVFMLAPTFIGQLGIGHTGLLVLYPAVLYMWALLRLNTPFASRRRLTLQILLVALLFVASLMGSLLLLFYLTLPVTLLVFGVWLWQRHWPALKHGMIAIALGGLFALPLLLPALSETLNAPPSFREDAAVRFSADLLTAVSPSFYNPLYASMTYNRAVLGVDPFEVAGYIGILTAMLALAGGVRFKRARPWLLLAAAAWLLSLGPLLKILGQPVAYSVDGYASYVSLPYALLQELPIIGLARTPARFNFSVAFALAIMAGYGLLALWTWLRRWPKWVKAGISIALMALIVLDTLWFVPMPTIPARVPEAIAALGERDDLRAVFDLPFDHLLVDKDGMFLQTGHGLPMIAGHIARITPLNPAKGYLLQNTLDPALLDAAGADVIILHKNWDDETGSLNARLREQLGAPYYEDDALAVFLVPAYTGAPPAFIVDNQSPPALTNRGEIYVYMPVSGGALLSASLASPQPRTITVLRDDVPLESFIIDGAADIQVWLEMDAGYHTIALQVDPACPTGLPPGVVCAGMTVNSLSLELPR